MSLEGIETFQATADFAEFDEVIDVRSPSEFDEDHVPGAINLPVLSDEQRHEVGTVYRNRPFEARRLGASYINARVAEHLGGELATRPKGWRPLLYCWRGGMRSRSFAVVLRSIGWRAGVLEGGYKAWRRFMIADLEKRFNDRALTFHLLSGLTGTAKSHLLTALGEAGAQILDLEMLANHRGSILGSMGPQPSQKRFESALYESISACDPGRPVFVEAESNRIGTVQLPAALWHRFRTGVVHAVSLPLEERVRHLLAHYPHFQEDPARLVATVDGLRRIRGNEIVDQWAEFINAGDWTSFVRSVLVNHYDKVYRRPGSEKSVYPAPSEAIVLADASPASLAAAAARVVSQHELLAT